MYTPVDTPLGTNPAIKPPPAVAKHCALGLTLPWG
jgi:hypothetical protein